MVTIEKQSKPVVAEEPLITDTCAFNPNGVTGSVCRCISGVIRNIPKCGAYSIFCKSPVRRCEACARQGGDLQSVAKVDGRLCAYHNEHGEGARIVRAAEPLTATNMRAESPSPTRNGRLELDIDVLALERYAKVHPTHRMEQFTLLSVTEARPTSPKPSPVRIEISDEFISATVAKIPLFSKRSLQVFILAGQGHSIEEIAKLIEKSDGLVSNCVSAIYKTLGLDKLHKGQKREVLQMIFKRYMSTAKSMIDA